MSINDIESFIYSPPPGAINDLRYENLRSEGYYGALNDMLYQKFRQKALNLVFDRLFINGEQGINKLDFSDFTGMYQDRARTIPYTAVEQPLGSFTGLNGVTATAPADVNRGVVSARVNLLTNTENMVPTLVSGTAWTRGAFGNWTTPTNLGPTLAPDGSNNAVAVRSVGAGGNSTLVHRASVFPSTTYKFTVQVRKVGGEDQTGLTSLRLLFQTGNNGVLVSAGASSVVIGTSVSESWKQFEISYTTPSTGVNQVEVGIWFSGVDASAVAVWGGSLTLAIDAHLPYQSVNTPTDYNTVGFPRYLAFNGTNTTYVTPSIDFTGTDKMTVWAGVTKLSDAAAAVFTELSSDVGTNGGSFYITAPETLGASGDLKFKSRGTTNAVPAPSGAVQAPVNAVVCGIGDIASDTSIIRVNGIQVGSTSSDQGTGNYGNYPLYIGARAGTSLFFNGRLYSLIVRGAATPLPHIEVVETLIRQKMRLP